jgi:Tfp pilus assembly protein PilF
VRLLAAGLVLVLTCCRTLPPVPEGKLHPRVRAQLEEARRAGTSTYCRMLHAYEEYRAAVDCYQSRTDSPYLEGAARAALGQIEPALRLLRQEPSEAAFVRAGELLLQAGRTAEARAEFSKGSSPAARFGQARAGSPDALEILESVCRDDPQAGPPRLLLASLLRQRGDTRRATREMAGYERGAKTAAYYPDPLYDELRRLRQDPGFFVEEGRRLQAMGDLAGAEREYAKALEMDPSFPAAHANLLAVAGMRGDPAAAEQHYRALADPAEEAHANWGKVLVRQGRYAEAAEAFRSAIRKAERFADAHHDLGYALLRLGDPAGAEKSYRNALAIEPDHAMAHLSLGKLMLASGRRAEAVAEFERVTGSSGAESAPLLYAAADGLQKAGRRDRARILARMALESARAHGQAELAGQIEQGLAILAR